MSTLSHQPPSQLPSVWLITGATSGFGLHLVKHLLFRPHCEDLVIASGKERSIHILHSLASTLPSDIGPRLRILELDITTPPSQIKDSLRSALADWASKSPVWTDVGVDVLVNNAGYGSAGVMEECGGEANGLRQCFEVNCFGHVGVTNALLPGMRARARLSASNAGVKPTIVFMGSRSAWKTSGPLTGLYNSSKAALHAITDAYRSELATFGIRVLGIQPGGFRTNTIRTAGYERILARVNDVSRENSARSDSKETEEGISPRFFLPSHPGVQEGRPLRIPPADDPNVYGTLNEMGSKFLLGRAGKEDGDPEKAVKVIADVVKGEGPSRHLPFPNWLALGPDCVNDIRERCDSVLKDVAVWEDISCGTDF